MRSIASLFSGIGLLEHGLERAGLGTTVLQAELDPYCRAVLARHWPNARRFDDVRKVTRHETDRVDVVCGGFPCQPISSAGKRLGDADPRWLWPEYARIVGELQPAIVVAENVPPLRSRGLRGVLADLASLGFDAEWCTFRAADIGAPHERARIWIVATHPDRVTVRSEPGWLSRACWAGARVARDNGTAWPLADADGLGWGPRADEGTRALGESRDGCRRSEADASPDADGSGREGAGGARVGGARRPVLGDERAGDHAAPAENLPSDTYGQGQPQPEGSFGELRGWASDSGWRNAPPAVRGVDDGHADGLDVRCARAGGCGGEACDHERAPDSWRVGALGNAVVEQCALLVGMATVDAISVGKAVAA